MEASSPVPDAIGRHVNPRGDIAIGALIGREQHDLGAYHHPISAGDGTALHNATLNLNSGRITLEQGVIFGHHVTVLTGTHDIRQFGEHRNLAWPREGRDVLIREGAWVATNATVLGPCTIGKHAVVAAGAVVTGDVAEYTVVAGVPAKPIGTIDLRAGPSD